MEEVRIVGLYELHLKWGLTCHWWKDTTTRSWDCDGPAWRYKFGIIALYWEHRRALGWDCKPSLEWGVSLLISVEVGNSNELNAAYAADGYSRIKGSPGVSELRSLWVSLSLIGDDWDSFDNDGSWRTQRHQRHCRLLCRECEDHPRCHCNGKSYSGEENHNAPHPGRFSRS